ncbi:hypothetical protein ABTZ59_36865 [Streptomyces sp. NPDC094034]|uniref:hypothetical protein n=1 Tax=Streptomyces sp. NPDC094034 TaxID=3155309 RepID=UPI003322318D
MSWTFTLAFGMAAIGLTVSLTYGLRGGPLAGVAVSLGMITIAHRIWGSRILLEESSLTIVNPLVTYTIPYKMITNVTSSGNGTLTIATRQGIEIRSTGFGGSIIDHFVGSTERAAKRVTTRLKRQHRESEQVMMTTRFTVVWIADLCAVGALTCATVAGLIGF